MKIHKEEVKALQIDKLDYLPGLDGIRALAALLVISMHWPNLLLSLKFGWIGVNIFFVLSGFLITRILVNDKNASFKSFIYNFFYKRTLRIFPVYYLYFMTCVFIILLIYFLVPRLSNNNIILEALNTIKYDSSFYLTYTYNIKQNLSYIFHLKRYASEFFGHVWTLAIEEQFYLVFPFIVYFSKVEHLKKILIVIIIICPIIRLWAATFGVRLFLDNYFLGQFLYTNTFCQADSLAFGALLAIKPIKLLFPYRSFFLVTIVCLSVGLICLIFLRKAGYIYVEGNSLGFNSPIFWFVEKTPWTLINIRASYQYTLVNVFSFFLIAPATIKKPLFPKLFESKPIKYLGKISYGIYLFHFPILAIFKLVVSIFGDWNKITALPLNDICIFLLYLTIVISLAHLSYKYFELKIVSKYKIKLKLNE